MNSSSLTESNTSLEPSSKLERTKGSEAEQRFQITAEEFSKGDYAKKVASGEVQVFDVTEPPGDEAPQSEKKLWEYMMLTTGIGIKVQRVEPVQGGNNLYKAYEGDFGNAEVVLKSDHKFVVYPKKELPQI